MTTAIREKTLINTSELSSSYLNVSQRPSELLDRIASAFSKLSEDKDSEWGLYNGRDEYSICNIDEQKLIKRIICCASKEQKEFFLLDIGAGNFNWSRATARYIDKQKDLPEGIKVHVIGVRGESSNFGNKTIFETKCCKIYNLSEFKVEEICVKLKGAGIDLENKVDFAVSRWCLRHLADPVGTFTQVYNLLRPRLGYFAFDGFFFSENRQQLGDWGVNRLIIDTKSPYLTTHYNRSGSLNHYILKRPDENPCLLPMSYSGCCNSSPDQQVGSGCITSFQRSRQPSDEKGFRMPCYIDAGNIEMCGDKKMYDLFNENELFLPYSRITWKPIHSEKKPVVSKTKILARYDVGFNNKLFMRGEGAPFLNWNRGIEMTCSQGPDLWALEFEGTDFTNLQYKVLINDVCWEKGNNHEIKTAQQQVITPNFC